MREVKISLPLIPNLSVNHYLVKSRHGFFKRKEIKDWQESLGWQIVTFHIEDWNMPITVRCDLIQNDNRTRDISNYSKVCLDAIEDTCGVNDQNYRWQDGDILIRKDEKPTLLITIKENDETLLSR